MPDLGFGYFLWVMYDEPSHYAPNRYEGGEERKGYAHHPHDFGALGH